MKIAGFCSGHDAAYCILNNGIPEIHNELERFNRIKDTRGDSMEFMFNTYKFGDIDYFTHCIGSKRDNDQWYKKSFDKCKKLGKWYDTGHHQAHAANAFYSSDFKEALIITIDGGGLDTFKNNQLRTCFTVWEGKDNKIKEIEIWPENELHLGGVWSKATKHIFNLSSRSPSQQGTVMGMAALGTPKYVDDFYPTIKEGGKLPPNWDKLNTIASTTEQGTFDVAASLQLATERVLKPIFDRFIKEHNPSNICLSGGVSLNCVLTGKLVEWYPNIKFYCDPVPYDAGLAIGSARYVYHDILDQPRIYNNPKNKTSYLGKCYSLDEVNNDLELFSSKVIIEKVTDEYVIDKLIAKNIISVFGGGSESGRRALGNRSILADPRHKETKDIVNEKVKHRQWFRPFAPSILKDEVINWFEYDIDSPYMSFAIPFKKNKINKVPAVVHFDNTARLQTVKEKENEWYYNFIKKFSLKTGVPILLNTSFNDREPIVETPEHAINCFLKTNIDYLYFRDYKLLISKK